MIDSKFSQEVTDHFIEMVSAGLYNGWKTYDQSSWRWFQVTETERELFPELAKVKVVVYRVHYPTCNRALVEHSRIPPFAWRD